VLWALLLYRLFADRQVPVGWAVGTVFFTAFIGMPLLRAYLDIPVNIPLARSSFLLLQLLGYVVGVGVREELFKALPLLVLIKLTPRMKSPAVGAVRQTGQLVHLVGPIYTNVVRIAMTPFFHGCLSGIFGYFIALSAANPVQRWPLLVAGWGMAAVLHGCFDTFAARSPLWGVLIEGTTFFLLMTYIVKARGLTSASQLGDGLFGPEPEPPPA
jgi:RsiW-degrading membrane proteinase PrsW (M82 family)